MSKERRRERGGRASLLSKKEYKAFLRRQALNAIGNNEHGIWRKMASPPTKVQDHMLGGYKLLYKLS